MCRVASVSLESMPRDGARGFSEWWLNLGSLPEGGVGGQDLLCNECKV